MMPWRDLGACPRERERERERVWLNPPYGRLIGPFVAKAHSEAVSGNVDLVTMLIPARVDTRWWHEYCAYGDVRFLKGRVAFVNAANGGSSMPAPFPSAVVTLRQGIQPSTRYVDLRPRSG